MSNFTNPITRVDSKRSASMAKPNFNFQKRQRELEKKKKNEEKMQRKIDKNAPPPTEPTDEPQGEEETQ
jgi:hypothetical protein